MESTLATTPIHTTPWLPSTSLPGTCLKHPLIGPTLKTLHSSSKTLHVPQMPGPLTLIELNPLFPPGLTPPRESRFIHSAPLTIMQFTENGRISPFSRIADLLPDRPIPLFYYMQVRHFLLSIKPPSAWNRDLSPFERLCVQPRPQQHLIASTYALLMAIEHPPTSSPFHKWEQDLSIDIPKPKQSLMLQHIHKGSTNLSVQENGYKILSRWYRTPDKVHKVHPTIPAYVGGVKIL